MAGSSMTFSYVKLGHIKKVIADWVSDASDGSVTATTTDKVVCGRLIKLTTDPGSPAPTDNYDIAVKDEKGVDVLAGTQNVAALGTRDTANTEETYLHLLNADNTPIGFATYPVVCDKLTISLANAGNSKAGQLILYVEGMLI